MPTSFDDILTHYRQIARNTRQLGDYLELLTKKYLQTDSVQQSIYKNVWLWNEWPDRDRLPDIGVDLVAERHDGEYTAIQCKFYNEAHKMQKNDVDSFLSASAREPFQHRIIVSTVEEWSSHAIDALENQYVPVQRLGLNYFRNSDVDWSSYRFDAPDSNLAKEEPKLLRDYQAQAVDAVLTGLETNSRGQMIMACGTGKTFTALRLIENFASSLDRPAQILYMVPSLALMSQTISEFLNNSVEPMHAYAVCSDTKVGRRSSRDDAILDIYDLQLPATTDGGRLADSIARQPAAPGITIVFATYHSIDAITEAQQCGLKEFDLIVCDEAHRTTGVTLTGQDESHFVKVHDNKNVEAKKRLYMTATPRIFKNETKKAAKSKDAEITSMDDHSKFGPEFYRLGFGEAVERGVLSDYKVLVLGVDESQVTESFQDMLSEDSSELKIDDVAKLIGCWNGLAKRRSGEHASGFGDDIAPMRRAVAFNRTIRASETVANEFSELVNVHLRNLDNEDPTDDLAVHVKHIDGKFNASQRERYLDWLKETPSDESRAPVCRILSNARCLTEGVDVPTLDAVLFLNPRRSMVDVIQAVGRVMRKAEGKEFGYVILPIAIPAGMSTSDALSNNTRYEVVWEVLQALRAHDERMDATINQIELNTNRPENIIVETVDLTPYKKRNSIGEEGGEISAPVQESQTTLTFPAEEWKDSVYARIVDKVGSRLYWGDWSKDISAIATKHIELITAMLASENAELNQRFTEFVDSLRAIINPAVDHEQAIEMIAQHLITKPVFQALFAGSRFTEQNPISMSMQNIVDYLDTNAALERERESLDRFYESVSRRVRDVDNAAAKQEIIKELYNNFFKNAFPRLADRHGIVFTPVPVVDYILRSADVALTSVFGKTLSDNDVTIIEPFAGTGTFVTRLLQLGLIRRDDLVRKFKREIFANEILLLSYYIAAINIETVFAEVAADKDLNVEYRPFEGMVLADTFQLSESDRYLGDDHFAVNSERAKKELEQDIQVIVMNPPWSDGQSNANDNNQNQSYPSLDRSIKQSYARQTTSGLKKDLYNSYVRAIRWASDRITDRGVIAFVSGGGFIDAESSDGLRKVLVDEFSSIYVYNLRGNQNTQGETSRREGGKIFGSDSRSPVAITVLVKDKNHKDKATLYYRDIGDYLTREAKLDILGTEQSIAGTTWEVITPNSYGDWIHQRNPKFYQYAALNAGRGKKEKGPTVFQNNSLGVSTNRDAWVYNFSAQTLSAHVTRLVNAYNRLLSTKSDPYSANKTEIDWSDKLLKRYAAGNTLEFDQTSIRKTLYRPFVTKSLYFDDSLNERTSSISKIFPTERHPNIAIATSKAKSKPFSAFMVDRTVDLHFIGDTQIFPRYIYEPLRDGEFNLGEITLDGYSRYDNITDEILTSYRETYNDQAISKDDIFNYVYGLLHHPQYVENNINELMKSFPRIPKVDKFFELVLAGKDLAALHLNYENTEKYNIDIEFATEPPVDRAAQFEFFKVTKMRIPKADRSKLLYNDQITLLNIPEEVYRYQVNGRSPIEWIVDQFQVNANIASNVPEDPNAYSVELGEPRYILDLLQKVMLLSLETQEIVETLPKFTVITDEETSNV